MTEKKLGHSAYDDMFDDDALAQMLKEDETIVGLAINEDYAKWAYGETNPKDTYKKPEALDDMLVLDVSYANFGALFASSILAELGAEVIRIEPPAGDLARKMTPYGIMIQDTGLAYMTEARNKFHITLNLESSEGQDYFRRLARKADVVIEAFKPGYMDSLGLGYEQLKELNPGLIYCAVHSYGQFGEASEKHGNQPDYDLLGQARGVIMSITGEPDLDPEVPPEYKRPVKQGNWMAWYTGGAWAAFGIQAAMFHKRRTGQGQLVDSAPPEGLLAISNYVMQYFHMTGNLMPRAGNYDYAVFPYTYVKCKDGYTFMSGFTDPNWAALCEIMDRPDLQRQFPTIKERLTPENQPTIQHEIEKFTENYTSDEILQMLTEYSRRPDKKGTVVTGRLENPTDVLTRDHWRVRETFIKRKDPHYGEVLIPNSSLKAMSRTPGRVKWICRPVGGDNEFIFQKYLGVGKTALAQLKDKGVV
ncbi:Crotonobetainyl-CoA:carnitine CoA-transferase CaiB [Desulfacinum hydrothermale DSM 13146]|uniref:Crotonobetainyl-CoA:carnitine CoA-transferase CaiB n=1 Tax=Desulfacinum hydrothermale DSM 13146 TaxID=1121390 RepID=A0A1W1X4Q8_9BACT|nr:CoA transferase [Desulfacinum hydrothermale]SMC18949.1 Crotonobetainyl-CoA:carnitine CoA-transferase CaiB [Desulfacinum hydrothermale DSM 13146]